MERSKVFVTGATGKFGGLVVDALLQRMDAEDVVVGVRLTGGDSADRLRAKSVELRFADYDKPETLATAFDGVGRLLLISSNAVGRRLVQHQNVIDAAKRGGVQLIAYTSILHADTSPMPLAAEHRPTEAALQAAGIPFVLLRNGWYTENYSFMIKPALQQGVYLGSAGEGRSSAASRADYAEAAAVVLSTQDHAGKTFELAGDDSFTLSELCTSVSEITGRTVTYDNVSELDLKESLLQLGFPAAMAATVAACDIAIKAGALEDHGHQLSTLIGRPTTPYTETIRQLIPSGGDDQREDV